jgi:cell wall-associated NlpC family hydrolase
MKINAEFVNEYIGIPYVCNARGPTAFDCYGLVLHVYERVANIKLPDWGVKDAETETAIKSITSALQESYDNDLFRVVDQPQDLDVAVLKRHKMAHHVGVYINHGILHCSVSSGGVVWERPSNFHSAGRGVLEYLRWNK